MTGFWRELERARKEGIRQDNARARKAKRLNKIQQAKDKLAETLARNGEGAMPSGSRIRVKEGSGSPMGSENSRSVRKRLIRSRVEHPTEKTLPVGSKGAGSKGTGSKGQKKQQGSMGKLSIPSTVKPSSAINPAKEEERELPRGKPRSKRQEKKHQKEIAQQRRESEGRGSTGNPYRKISTGGRMIPKTGKAPTISEKIADKERIEKNNTISQESENNFCENCGNELKQTTKFCGKCGTKV